MYNSSVVKFLLFVSFALSSQSVANEQATTTANFIKILIQTTAKPGHLTVMACWNSGTVQINS